MLPFFPLANGLLTGQVRGGGHRRPAPASATSPSGPPGGHRRGPRSSRGPPRGGRRRTVEDAPGAGDGVARRPSPAVGSVIAGATKPEQVVANAMAVKHTEIGPELATAIDAATTDTVTDGVLRAHPAGRERRVAAPGLVSLIRQPDCRISDTAACGRGEPTHRSPAAPGPLRVACGTERSQKRQGLCPRSSVCSLRFAAHRTGRPDGPLETLTPLRAHGTQPTHRIQPQAACDA